MDIFDLLNDFSMLNDYDDRVVARLDKSDLVVSTAAVVGFKPYETAVAHPRYSRRGDMVIVEAYDTKDEAKAGHDRWVKTMTAEKLPDALIDCINSELAKFLKDAGDPMVFPKKDVTDDPGVLEYCQVCQELLNDLMEQA